MTHSTGRRVWIIGGPASGKTTLARACARKLSVPHIELDNEYWGDDWIPMADAEFAARIDGMLDGEGWVVDGQYAQLLDMFGDRADCMIWLDPPFWAMWRRLLRRTLRRLRSREQLWRDSNNTESYWSVVGPRSILWLAILARRRGRIAAERIVAARHGAGLQTIRCESLRSAESLDSFLSNGTHA